MKEGEFGKLPIHLAIGHEEIACGVAAAMKPEDRLILTHRNIAYHLAKGTTVDQLADGYKGPFGSMNLINPDVGIVYTSSILGNQFPVAVGVALGCGGVVYVLGGDGSMEEGAFYESLVLAAATKAKVVFIIEHNGWSMSTPFLVRRKHIDIERMSQSLGVGVWIARYASGHDEYRRLLTDINTYPCVFAVTVLTRGGSPNYHCGPLKETP